MAAPIQPPVSPSATRVLVLDDDDQVRRTCALTLSRAGCHVETAADGREGLRILLQRDFDVLVVDIDMAVVSGDAFLAEARSVWPWLGVVIVSGIAPDTVRRHAERFRVRHVLLKPVESEALVQAVAAESDAKRQRVTLTAGRALDRIQDQLTLLRRFSEQAIGADNLEEALLNLSHGLGNLLPCDAVGVVSIDEDKHYTYLTPIRPVSESFLDELDATMHRRVTAFTGIAHHGESLRVNLAPGAHGDAAVTSVGATFSVPLVTGDRVCGLLTLATGAPERFDADDLAFLYHASGSLCTVLAALRRIRDISVHDTLTGVFNRRGLEEEYERHWLLSRRHGHPLAVAVLDLDHFKAVNDSQGHPVGDEILREFAQVVQRVARATDIIARYGGDEMVVILPMSEVRHAMAFATRLLEAVRRQIFGGAVGSFRLTVSVGVAAARPREEPSLTSSVLLAHADTALIAAKRAGRDRVLAYEPALGPDAFEPPTRGADAQNAAPRVLVVDDDEAVAITLTKMLELRGYEAVYETSAMSAVELLRQGPGRFAVLITDLNLGDATGLDLLDRIRTLDDSLVRIVITGFANLDNAVMSMRRGAYDFIQKPVMANQLYAVLERAMEYRRLREENRRYQQHLEELVLEKSSALREALEQVETSYQFTLEALVAMLDARETNTGKHSIRVRDLATILAREMNLSDSEINDIAQGALLHDIGKIAISDAILLKPGPLTDAERTIIRSHPETGYRILQSSSYLSRAARIVMEHQERFDGAGYPHGLRGHDICIGARIFAVVDAYDAMRSNRVYRRAMSVDDACAELQRGRGTQFDPDVVEAFMACRDRIEQAGRWDQVSADPARRTVDEPV